MARARLIGVVLIAAGAFGCSFRGLPLANDGDGGVLFEDAPVADAYIPDAGACINSGKTCAGPILRTCQMEGQFPPDEEVCNWSCISEPGPPRCGRLRPSGGVLTLADLDADAALMERKRTGNGVINTDDGSITGLRAAGTGVVDGIDFAVRPLGNGRSAGVFRVRKLNLEGSWDVRGTNALAIAAFTDIGIKGRLDASGDCNGTNAGPGGFPGGAASTAAAAGTGGGAAGETSGNSSSGGGGGAYGDTGGEGGKQNGADRPAAGIKWGNDTITALVGGGGGGGGGNGVGGGGGGAVQLAANGTITVEYGDTGSLFNGINAGGCGGGGGGSNNGGGGGGAGGTILIEAKTFVLDYALIAVNGGGGGGGNSNNGGGTGEWGNDTARGGTGAMSGGSGGRGGAAGNRPGARGTDAKEGGGGGGGVGRIRINTLDAQGIQLKNFVIISPSFGEGSTTSTKGAASVQ